VIRSICFTVILKVYDTLFQNSYHGKINELFGFFKNEKSNEKCLLLLGSIYITNNNTKEIKEIRANLMIEEIIWKKNRKRWQLFSLKITH
jgi:hypothetical protein